MSTVTIDRASTLKAGSCTACGRHPDFDSDAPLEVTEISLGDRHTITIRLCYDCWQTLVRKMNR